MMQANGQCSQPESWMTNPSHMPSQPAAILNCQIDSDLLLFYFKVAWVAVRSAAEFAYTYKLIILLSVILLPVLYMTYKSFFSPVAYVKELLDVGYDHIPKGVDRDIKVARALKNRQLGAKLPPPYPNGWFALVETCDLKIGGVTSVDALGQNFCVYRGEDGVARCVEAYCPHLGANMGIGGKVGGNCIECPFHKWKFDPNGTCVYVPGLENPPQGVSIKTWPTVEADGAVWIWHDVEGRDPLWGMEDAEEIKKWGYRGKNEFVVGSHIMDIPENGADASHLSAVHATSVLTTIGEKYPFLVNFIGHHTWHLDWSRDKDVEHMAILKLHHEYSIGKFNVLVFDVVAQQIGPGHVRLRLQTGFGPILISQSVTPIGPLQQRVIHRLFSPWYNAPIVATMIYGESYMSVTPIGPLQQRVIHRLFSSWYNAPRVATMIYGESYMFERDMVIWNNKRYTSSPVYVRLDKCIRGFRAWYSQFYSENSLSFKDAIRNPLDW